MRCELNAIKLYNPLIQILWAELHNISISVAYVYSLYGCQTDKTDTDLPVSVSTYSKSDPNPDTDTQILE